MCIDVLRRVLLVGASLSGSVVEVNVGASHRAQSVIKKSDRKAIQVFVYVGASHCAWNVNDIPDI